LRSVDEIQPELTRPGLFIQAHFTVPRICANVERLWIFNRPGMSSECSTTSLSRVVSWYTFSAQSVIMSLKYTQLISRWIVKAMCLTFTLGTVRPMI
jgi:hypothetical protein